MSEHVVGDWRARSTWVNLTIGLVLGFGLAGLISSFVPRRTSPTSAADPPSTATNQPILGAEQSPTVTASPAMPDVRRQPEPTRVVLTAIATVPTPARADLAKALPVTAEATAWPSATRRPLPARRFAFALTRAPTASPSPSATASSTATVEPTGTRPPNHPRPALPPPTSTCTGYCLPPSTPGH